MSGGAHHRQQPRLALHPAVWREDAACYGTDVEAWFPGKGSNGGPVALRICRTCPVRVDCLTDALVTENPSRRYGIWGGLSAHQRSQAWHRLSVEERAVYRPQGVDDLAEDAAC